MIFIVVAWPQCTGLDVQCFFAKWKEAMRWRLQGRGEKGPRGGGGGVYLIAQVF